MIRPELQYERDERAELFRCYAPYAPHVRIGAWFTTQALKDEKVRLYRFKKERELLLSQKTRRMFQNLLTPTQLDLFPEFLSYNKFYQVKTFEVQDVTPCEKLIQKTLYLSAIVTDNQIDSVQELTDGCVLTASEMSLPCSRNTFYFTNACDPKRTGFVIYDEELYIQFGGSSIPLFITAKAINTNTLGGAIVLEITQQPSTYSRFKILSWQKELRDETNGTPVVHNSYVVFQHVASGSLLACEFSKAVTTFFGAERIVSCKTFRDAKKRVTSENLWKICGTLQKQIKIS